MSMKNSKYALSAILMLCAGCFMNATAMQPGFEENVDDVAPLPGLIAAAVVGLFIGARKMYNSRNK